MSLVYNGVNTDTVIYNGQPTIGIYNGAVVWGVSQPPTPPAPNRDGIVFRVELTNSQTNQMGFNAVSVDCAPIYSAEIYKGRYLLWGNWTDISSSDLERIITGQQAVYCNTIELWIAEPYASSLSFSTMSWVPDLIANVYIDEYVNPDTITGELVRRQQTLNTGVEYTYNW